MSFAPAVKAMVRTNVVMTQLGTEERRLERNVKHVAELRRQERAIAQEQDIKEEDMRLYHDVLRWQREAEDAKAQVAAWKAELATSRSQFFSEEEVAALKTEGALAALLNELERADASKIPMMLQKNGADFIPRAKWAIKDRYFWNGCCPW